MSAFGAVKPKMGLPLEGTHEEYPYENVVFQGGGAKCAIYGGAVVALEELGILAHVKRVAGTSAGGLAAVFVALGLGGEQAVAETDAISAFEDYLDGGKGWPLGGDMVVQAYNFFTWMGAHPASLISERVAGVLEKYTGNGDITFLELYKLTGRELCLSVSNVSRQQMELCHVNTTPNMPVVKAVRASMSIPFAFEPVELFEGETYVDGALFNNFALKSFDGWFLSTRKEDGIFATVKKFHPEAFAKGATRQESLRAYKEAMATSFAEPNMATIGFRVSDEKSAEDDRYTLFLEELDRRLGASGGEADAETSGKIELPDTALARAFRALHPKLDAEKEEAYVDFIRWMLNNPRDLLAQDVDQPHAIKTADMTKALNESPPDFSHSLFGYDSWDKLVDAVDRDGDGIICRSDFHHFWDRNGVRHPFMKNKKAKTINSVTELGTTIAGAMFSVAEEALLRDPVNAKRICTLNSIYVGLAETGLVQEDRDFLYKVGRAETISWLKNKKEADEAAPKSKKRISWLKNMKEEDEVVSEDEEPWLVCPG